MGTMGNFAMSQITSTNTHEPTLTIVKKVLKEEGKG